MHQSSYKSDSAYFNGAPIFTDWAQCAAYPGIAGDIGYVPRLVGPGFFQVQYTGSRWSVVPGQSIAALSEPANLGPAPNLNPIDVAFCILPADLIGNGEQWEIAAPHQTGTNVGSDAFHVYFGGTTFISVVTASASGAILTARLCRTGANVSRVWTVLSTLNAVNVDVGIDLSSNKDVFVRIIPATVGNTQRIRYLGLSRIN